MAEEYKRLVPLKRSLASEKESSQKKYWKSFKETIKEKLELKISQVKICKDATSKIFVSHGLSVNLFDLNSGKIEETFRDFKDTILSIDARPDSLLFIASTSSGSIHAFQTSTKIRIKNYLENKMPVNCIKLSPNLISFVSGCNDLSIRFYNLHEEKSFQSIVNAHDDYIRDVVYLDTNTIITSGYDSYIKIWDTREYQCSAIIKGKSPIEKMITTENNEIATAQSNKVIFYELRKFGEILSFSHHSSSISSLAYNNQRKSLLCGGTDGRLVFSSDWKKEYSLKFDSGITTIDFASNGSSYGLGLASGDLLILKKNILGKNNEILDDEEILEQNLISSLKKGWVKHGKDYRYFYRGSFNKVPENLKERYNLSFGKKIKLQEYERKLKQFKYRDALLLSLKSPEIVITLIEELIQRNCLILALINLQTNELKELLTFILWKIIDPKYQDHLLSIANILVDLYSPIFGENTELNEYWIKLNDLMNKEYDVCKNMCEIEGDIELIDYSISKEKLES